MKNILTLFIVSILFFNCVNKTPELNEEDYKKEQLEYEVLKEKLSGVKEAFFIENKDNLIKKVSLFKQLKDSTTVFDNVNTDSLFFLKDVKLSPINFRGFSREGGEKVVFLDKREAFFNAYPLIEPYKQLYSCEENGFESCKSVKTEVLKTFLDIKYAFVIDGFTIMEPSIDTNNTFSSGLFFASVLVYDFTNNKPLYEYSFTVTNSEEISYRDSKNSFLKQKPIAAIKRDFYGNISNAIREETKKHFDI